MRSTERPLAVAGPQFRLPDGWTAAQTSPFEVCNAPEGQS
jgi:hypothetical protein